jgi:hypothetical protein
MEVSEGLAVQDARASHRGTPSTMEHSHRPTGSSGAVLRGVAATVAGSRLVIGALRED